MHNGVKFVLKSHPYEVAFCALMRKFLMKFFASPCQKVSILRLIFSIQGHSSAVQSTLLYFSVRTILAVWLHCSTLLYCIILLNCSMLLHCNIHYTAVGWSWRSILASLGPVKDQLRILLFACQLLCYPVIKSQHWESPGARLSPASPWCIASIDFTMVHSCH